MDISHNDEYVLVTNKHPEIEVLDIVKNKQLFYQHLPEQNVREGKFNKNSNMFFACSGNEIKIWNTHNLKNL